MRTGLTISVKEISGRAWRRPLPPAGKTGLTSPVLVAALGLSPAVRLARRKPAQRKLGIERRTVGEHLVVEDRIG